MSDKREQIIFYFSEWLSDLYFSLSKKVLWSNRDALHKKYTIIAVAMLIGLLPMPYEYYITLRVLVCYLLWSYFLALRADKLDIQPWRMFILALIFLYNPIAPIHMGSKFIWLSINMCTLYALYRLRRILSKADDEQIESASDK